MPETSSRPLCASMTANFAEELPQFRTRMFMRPPGKRSPCRTVAGGDRSTRDEVGPYDSRRRWRRKAAKLAQLGAGAQAPHTPEVPPTGQAVDRHQCAAL